MSFTSIFPGSSRGRWPVIHYELTSDASLEYGELYFDQETIEMIFEREEYGDMPKTSEDSNIEVLSLTDTITARAVILVNLKSE